MNNSKKTVIWKLLAFLAFIMHSPSIQASEGDAACLKSHCVKLGEMCDGTMSGPGMESCSDSQANGGAGCHVSHVTASPDRICNPVVPYAGDWMACSPSSGPCVEWTEGICKFMPDPLWFHLVLGLAGGEDAIPERPGCDTQGFQRERDGEKETATGSGCQGHWGN